MEAYAEAARERSAAQRAQQAGQEGEAGGSGLLGKAWQQIRVRRCVCSQMRVADPGARSWDEIWDAVCAPQAVWQAANWHPRICIHALALRAGRCVLPCPGPSGLTPPC